MDLVLAAALLSSALALILVCGLWLAGARGRPPGEAKGFIGRLAVVTGKEARRGAPARALLLGEGGADLSVLVEPDEDETFLAAGARVLLTERRGRVFRAMTNSHPALSCGDA